MTEASDNPLVKAHREVVERVWTAPVLKLCGSDLPVPDNATVLSAESRCGAVVKYWLDRLPTDTRMMALDSYGPMLDEARGRVASEEEQRRIFFVQQRVSSLSYAAGVFDACVCLHGMTTVRQAREGMEELNRVTASGGRLVACFPLLHSFSEFYDMVDEAMRACKMQDPSDRLDQMKANLLDGPRLAQLFVEQEYQDLSIHELSWEVAFGSGREFLYSPLIQETFFSHWSGAIPSAMRDEILQHVENAIDTYWRGRTLHTQVKAALLLAQK